MRRAVLIAVLLGGCHFGLKGVDGGSDQTSDDAGVGSEADLALSVSPSDMGGFLPSHVPPGTLNSEAADLPLGITAIDTSALTSTARRRRRACSSCRCPTTTSGR